MALKHVLGKAPMITVIDFMLGHIEHDITVKEIIEYTGVGQTDMKRDFPGLLECGVVTETRKIGGVQLYMLNNDNVVVDALIDLDNVLTNYMSGEIARPEAEEPEPEEPEPEDFDARPAPEVPEKYPESKEVWES